VADLPKPRLLIFTWLMWSVITYWLPQLMVRSRWDEPATRDSFELSPNLVTVVTYTVAGPIALALFKSRSKFTREVCGPSIAFEGVSGARILGWAVVTGVALQVGAALDNESYDWAFWQSPGAWVHFPMSVIYIVVNVALIGWSLMDLGLTSSTLSTRHAGLATLPSTARAVLFSQSVRHYWHALTFAIFAGLFFASAAIGELLWRRILQRAHLHRLSAAGLLLGRKRVLRLTLLALLVVTVLQRKLLRLSMQ